jgi:uncharacterized small protein (TIGR04563 family)
VRGKQSLYFPEEMLAELQAEAQRLDRSVAWLVERAWKIAKRQVMSLSTEKEVEDGPSGAEADLARCRRGDREAADPRDV